MDDATFTSDAVPTTRQLMAIRSSMSKENEDEDSRDLDVVIKDLAKKGVTLNREQLTALSTEFLLTVLLDVMLLRLLDKGATVSSDRQQLMDVAAAAKKKRKAAAKRRRYKRNKAAAKHKKIKLMSWLSGGIISVIMMVAFSFITTPIVTLSLFQPSYGSGEGKAPPALPPSASKSLRQEDLESKNEASTSPANIIISPLAAVVPPPVFTTPTALSKRKDDEIRASSRALSTASSSKPSSSPSISSPPTQVCFDTPNWEDKWGYGCDYYEEWDLCLDSLQYAGDMGHARTHCCICAGTTCEDFRLECQKYINVLDLGFNEIGLVEPLCKEAESFCCEAADHDVEVDEWEWGSQTVGLYNECKCDFWSRLCKDTRAGEACDYAAEYCCGDYKYDEFGGFEYLNSPTCYCDFFNYAQNEFGHKLEPKALNISKEFENPCGQIQEHHANMMSAMEIDIRRKFERPSLEAIYNETVGQNWTNSAGWMNEADHCDWYGITCDSDGYVSSIDLRDNNLSGQFPAYTRDELYGHLLPESDWIATKYGLANLYNLRRLDLANNKLTGTIEYRPLYNLHLLTHFDVSGNQLSGDVDALIAPLLTHVDFSNNRFTSMRRFEQYKVSPLQTLRFCDVSNNAIIRKATDLLENIPPNIEHFFASNNQIYGSLPESLNNLPKLRQFDMSYNALSGSLPDFEDSILSLQQLDLSNQKNGIIGSIPKNPWRFLEVLNLAGNKLTGPIPPDIRKMTALEEFYLSNNLLSGRIPSQLGHLAGSLQVLDLANNDLYGRIPTQIGQLQGASVILKGNNFNDSSIAPLSLCIEEFDLDLASDTTLCPVERTALSDFYDSTKGAEWTDRTNWLDEYESYCNWYGVNCDKGHVTKLELSNNGLSGRLRESIGDLAFIEVLDLSDNDIKGSIPTEIARLSNLTYLRLSYNAFTGTAEGLSELTKLQLLHLQSNRITGMPIMTQSDDAEYGNSTFVADCGVPSAFNDVPKCEHCTMCCNANDDCYPTEKTGIAKFGNGKFAAVFFPCFIVFSSMVALFSYHFRKRKNRGNCSVAMIRRIGEEDDNYALSRIGKESVYSYFVTDKPIGWLAAFATLGIQIGILAFFVMASEANLQKDTIDIVFTWKCPRDSDVCDNKADLDVYGWVIFSLLMIAFLAKDMINGCKLIYYSSKVRHTLGSKIRYFIGGMGLFSITLFALYVSTVYNKAIATSNTEIIVNSVIVLFIMEIDEYIFSALDAINEKWAEHAADKEVSEMKAQIESQQEEIDNQRNDIRMLREAVEKLQQSQVVEASDSDSQSAEFEGNTGAQQMEQVDEITMPSEAEQKIQVLNAAVATSSNATSKCTAQESITTHAAESDSDDTGSGTGAGKGGETKEVKDENALQKDEIVLKKERPAQ